MIMSSGHDLLLKILKDKTRRKIILLLAEKKEIAYTELMNTLKIINTGKLNYHLKILNDLLAKNESGSYQLTEKGLLAAKLLQDFPEPNKQLTAKKKYWRRFWFAAIILDLSFLTISLILYFLGFMDTGQILRTMIGFSFGLFFLYFFYRMIRPLQGKDIQKKTRTIKDILVFNKSLQEVRDEVMNWIKDEKIIIELDHEDFIRGRLGTPSGLGLTAPKYFEITIKPDPAGALVHTEGWESVFDVRERCFSKLAFFGLIPRRKGWIVINKLWNQLEKISKK